MEAALPRVVMWSRVGCAASIVPIGPAALAVVPGMRPNSSMEAMVAPIASGAIFSRGCRCGRRAAREHKGAGQKTGQR